MTQRNLIDCYQSFGGTSCLHLRSKRAEDGSRMFRRNACNDALDYRRDIKSDSILHCAAVRSSHLVVLQVLAILCDFKGWLYIRVTYFQRSKKKQFAGRTVPEQYCDGKCRRKLPARLSKYKVNTKLDSSGSYYRILTMVYNFQKY
jgi:hypothetical protein